MQRLQVKIKNKETGLEELKNVTVRRSWSTPQGTVYLHGSGVYGYKDGAPVRSRAELEKGINDRHLPAALNWWDGMGKEFSAKFYEGSESVVKMADPFYIRYQGKKPKTPEPGQSWLSFGFDFRPGWWGEAESITIGGFTYELVEEEPEAAPAETPKTVPVNTDDF